MFYIKDMQNVYYRFIQPADVFSLLLDDGGIREVGFYYHNIIPNSIRDKNGNVVKDFTDTRKVFGVIEKNYNPNDLWKIYTSWSRGDTGFLCDEFYIKDLIETAQRKGVYFLGTDKPYYKGGA